MNINQKNTMEHTEMTTLTTVLENLRVRNQDKEFSMTEDGSTAGTDKYYEPQDLTIIKAYRFEGDSNPDDSSVLYLIEANDGLIGYSLDAYGAYSSHSEKYTEFLRKIKVEDRDEQLIFDLSNK